MTVRRRLVALVVCAVPLALSATSCGQGLLFAQDRRVEIVSPAKDNAKVTLPLTVRWTLEPGTEVGRQIGSFAVFFDTEPQAPDDTIDVLARRDAVCKRTPNCPDAAYYAQRGIYVTEETSITLTDLFPVAGVDLDRGDHDRHDVTVIILDAKGRRMTEASWSRTFEIVHPERTP